MIGGGGGSGHLEWAARSRGKGVEEGVAGSGVKVEWGGVADAARRC